MKILVIGGGGREHALIWKLAQSPSVTSLHAAPGNPGIGQHATCHAISPTDIEALLTLAQREAIDLTVVGPEAPLAAGIVDTFQAAGLTIFGPTRAAAELESSKAFAKNFLHRHEIPTARYGVFTTAAEAKTYVAQHAFPLVIKADGLAAGKGVVIAANQAEAESTIDAMLSGRRHGAAGERIVIEEFLAGDELSCIAIVDGERYLLCEGSRDHKALEDGDQGPNTGGMGAFSPTHLWNETRRRTIATTVIEPTIAGLARDERRFSGFLYAGLMIVNGNPYVLEYNVRMGDPEAQALLIRLQSDLAEVLLSAATGNLQSTALQWDPRAACCVVMAAPGYPGPVTTGTPIQGLDAAAQIADCVVFHAGTASNDGQLVTAGGRVVGVTALGEDLRIAQASAYEAVGMIDWPGVQHRTDIGMKELC